MLKNYFKTAIRSLLRSRVYSVINILGLSLGLACAMLIILYVKDELSFDRFHAKEDRIYRIISQATSPDGSQTRKMGITGYFQGPHFAARVPGIESFVRVQGSSLDIKTATEVKSQPVLYVDSTFFTAFTFPFLSGNPRTALLQPGGVVISEKVARREFGTTAALGKTILFKTRTAGQNATGQDKDPFMPYTVTGVTTDCPQNSSLQFDVVLPMRVTAAAEANPEGWFNFFLNTYVVLSPQADPNAINAKLQAAYKADAGESIRRVEKKYNITDKTVYLLQPFTHIHLDKDVDRMNLVKGSDPIFSYILSGIAIFILLIASINFVNLTVARSLKRAKEIGIRKVVGGSRRQLMAQFLGEAFLLSFVAFVLALVLVKAALPVFNGLANKSLSLSYLVDARLVAAYAGLFVLTGLLAGFYPALVLSGYDPVRTLYNRFTLGGKNYGQKSLVVIQFALASFLIIATATLYAQFNFLTNERLGYDDSNLVVTYKNDLSWKEVDLLRQELSKYPDILGVAPKDNGYSFNGAKINGDSTIGFVNTTIDEGYLPLLKIPIVRGRNFSPAFPADSSGSVLVNETFVKQAGWQEPLGQAVVLQGKTWHVVGVVKDYHVEALQTEIKPQLFSMSLDNGLGDVYIRIRPNSETGSLQYIAQVFRKLFPLSPWTYSFQNETNRKNYEAEARWKQILLFGAVITIFISCVGLFGLSVLAAERRTKEIGVRKVLGASVQSVVAILSTDFLRLVLLSLVLSIPVSWIVANKWLQNYAYRIHLGWELFTVAGLAVVFIALATVSFQAVKAAMANPVKSLRTD